MIFFIIETNKIIKMRAMLFESHSIISIYLLYQRENGYIIEK